MKIPSYKNEIACAILLVGACFVGPLLSPYFADANYLLQSTTLFVELGLLALGLTLVIATGNIDLSPASNLALCGCVLAKLCASGMSPVIGVCLSVGLGGLLGLFNGLMTAWLRLPSFLVTLGTLAMFRGAAQALMGAESVPLPDSMTGVDRVFVGSSNVPVSLIVFIFGAILTGVLVRSTVFGRRILAVGSNERASVLSVVPTRRVTVAVFVFLGLIAGVCGVLMASRLGVARFDHAKGLELEAITAVVLGGTSIMGGRASVTGTVLAVLLIGVARTSMGLANIKAEIQMMVIGVVLITTLLFSGTNRWERWGRFGPTESATAKE
ncbi:MAG: ABC transporter permease [Fimbriimonadales bacterium]